MITILKTNVKRANHARRLIDYLLQRLPGSKINLDLKDCDKVLRVETEQADPEKIVNLVKQTGFSCAPL